MLGIRRGFLLPALSPRTIPAMTPDSKPASPLPPAQVLRAHTTGMLLSDGGATQIRYVIDPVTGEPVISLGPENVDGAEWVLCIPEEADTALRIAATPIVLDPTKDPACDRWIGYHGTPEQFFYRLFTSWARLGVEVFDGPEARAISKLGRAEVALVRKLNASALVQLGFPAGSRTVGVDELGVDIRTPRGVERLPFETPATTSDEAAERVDSLLRKGAS